MVLWPIVSHWRIRKFADATVHTHPNSQRIQKFAPWRPYWEKKMWIQVFPDMCRQGLKVTTVFFFRFQKVILSVSSSQKCEPQGQIKSLLCTKKKNNNNNNNKETQWNGRFSRKLRRPSSKCNTSPSHLKQLRQSLIIYSNKSL